MRPGLYVLALLIALAIGCSGPTLGTIDAGITAPDIATDGLASFTVPGSVGRFAVNVNQTDMVSMLVTNTGTENLMITVALDGTPNSTRWQPLQCTSTACPLPAGDSLSIDLAFSPLEHGDFDTTIQVFGPPAVGSQTVSLLGTGLGGKLRVDEPGAPFVLDFGTIGKNQLVTLPVKMSNAGNADLSVTPSDPMGVFSLGTSALAIPDGEQKQLDVSCMAGAAMPEQVGTITLDTDAYAQNTPSVEVRCTIANTGVQVTNPLDFHELRTGDPPGMIELTVKNPMGNGAVQIQRIDLLGAPTALELTRPALPATLNGGDSITGMLVLATDADVTLEGVTLEVQVTEGATNATLQQPVSGKVGTAAAVVLPTTLDLGTICVGTPVDGQITMTNTGSATLRMKRPTMDSEHFVPLFTNPTDYPAEGAPLGAGDKATVGVMASSATPGLKRGTLVWDVDAPNAPFQIPIALELVMEGTALSPKGLTFGSVAISEPTSAQQTITLENCGPDPAIVSYHGVTAHEGAASAWVIEPDSQQRELLPDEQMRIRVAFAPSEPGRHAADLPIEVGDETRIVALDGDATGELPEETSFYACGCGSTEPQRGWPILLALGFVLRRRRC